MSGLIESDIQINKRRNGIDHCLVHLPNKEQNIF